MDALEISYLTKKEAALEEQKKAQEERMSEVEKEMMKEDWVEHKKSWITSLAWSQLLGYTDKEAVDELYEQSAIENDMIKKVLPETWKSALAGWLSMISHARLRLNHDARVLHNVKVNYYKEALGEGKVHPSDLPEKLKYPEYVYMAAHAVGSALDGFLDLPKERGITEYSGQRKQARKADKPDASLIGKAASRWSHSRSLITDLGVNRTWVTIARAVAVALYHIGKTKSDAEQVAYLSFDDLDMNDMEYSMLSGVIATEINFVFDHKLLHKQTREDVKGRDTSSSPAIGGPEPEDSPLRPDDSSPVYRYKGELRELRSLGQVLLCHYFPDANDTDPYFLLKSQRPKKKRTDPRRSVANDSRRNTMTTISESDDYASDEDPPIQAKRTRIDRKDQLRRLEYLKEKIRETREV